MSSCAGSGVVYRCISILDARRRRRRALTSILRKGRCSSLRWLLTWLWLSSCPCTRVVYWFISRLSGRRRRALTSILRKRRCSSLRKFLTWLWLSSCACTRVVNSATGEEQSMETEVLQSTQMPCLTPRTWYKVETVKYPKVNIKS